MFGFKSEADILDEAIIEVKKKKRKKNIIFITVVSLIIVMLLSSVWGLGYSLAYKKQNAKIDELKKQIADLIVNPVVLDPVTPEIVMKTLNDKTKDVSELVTAEYIFTNAARFTNTKHIAVLPKSWTQKSFVQKWDGIIKAGIDLKKLDVEVNTKGKKIIIQMPSADIISYEIDNDSVEILDEKNNIFNRITVKDKVNFDKKTAYEMKSRAVKNGLLTKAQENAEAIIEEIIRTGVGKLENTQGIQDYKFEFETIDE